MIGIGLSIVQLAVRQLLGGAPFTPAILFGTSDQGVWYDPSDFTALFQDSAGTTPVTALEQPVGLMLDKSKGLVLGPELVVNGDFSAGTTGWQNSAPTSDGTIAAVSGKLRVTRTGGGFAGVQGIFVQAGKSYLITGDVVRVSGATTCGIYVKVAIEQTSTIVGFTNYENATAVTQLRGVFTAPSTATVYVGCQPGSSTSADFDNISVRELPGNHARQPTATSRPVVSARVNQYLNTETLVTQNVTTVATSYTLRFEGAGTVTLSGTATGTYSAGTRTITCTAGTLTSTVAGSVTKADLRVANDGVGIPSYQRVNTATDYQSLGFPQAESFDGVDDFQITAAGGGSTTAFFFCAAIRLNKVGAAQTIFSDTGTNTGYRVRINASNQLEFSAGNGAAYTTISTTATLGIGSRVVITCWHDGTNLNAQINNGTIAQGAFATATAGTAQITLGQDNNAATSYFGGRLYQEVYLKNEVPTPSEITATKTYCANAGKITL